MEAAILKNVSHQVMLKILSSRIKSLTMLFLHVICKSTHLEITSPQSNHTSPPSTAATFLATCLMAVLQPPGIPSSTVEILLFNLVFHDRVTPVSVSTLKPPLEVIGVLLLKP